MRKGRASNTFVVRHAANDGRTAEFVPKVTDKRVPALDPLDASDDEDDWEDGEFVDDDDFQDDEYEEEEEDG